MTEHMEEVGRSRCIPIHAHYALRLKPCEYLSKLKDQVPHLPSSLQAQTSQRHYSFRIFGNGTLSSLVSKAVTKLPNYQELSSGSCTRKTEESRQGRVSKIELSLIRPTGLLSIDIPVQPRRATEASEHSAVQLKGCDNLLLQGPQSQRSRRSD